MPATDRNPVGVTAFQVPPGLGVWEVDFEALVKGACSSVSYMEYGTQMSMGVWTHEPGTMGLIVNCVFDLKGGQYLNLRAPQSVILVPVKRKPCS